MIAEYLAVLSMKDGIKPTAFIDKLLFHAMNNAVKFNKLEELKKSCEGISQKSSRKEFLESLVTFLDLVFLKDAEEIGPEFQEQWQGMLIRARENLQLLQN